MAEYQKFIFSENYSTEPENLKKIQETKLAEAQQLMAQDIEKAKQFAFEQGFQEGQKMALEKLKAEMDTHVNSIADAISKINQYKPELHNMFEQQSTACVRHLVNNLYFKSQEIMPDKILNQAIENALENLPFVSRITLKVPRNCKNYIQDTSFEDKIRAKGITDFQFIEDLTLGDGQCLVEWDKSGVLSSKVESFEKINSSLNSFLSPEDIELSDNTTSQFKENKDANNTQPQQTENQEVNNLDEQILEIDPENIVQAQETTNPSAEIVAN